MKLNITKIILFCISIIFCSTLTHAALVTEYWSAEVDDSDIPSLYQASDSISWRITYDDASLVAHQPWDGPDDIAYTADDDPFSPANEISYFSGKPMSDATFVFEYTPEEFFNASSVMSKSIVAHYHYQWRYVDNSDNVYHQMSHDFFYFRYEHQYQDGYFWIRGGDENGLYTERRIDFRNAIQIDSVPVPSTVVLLGVGLLSLAGVNRKKN